MTKLRYRERCVNGVRGVGPYPTEAADSQRPGHRCARPDHSGRLRSDRRGGGGGGLGLADDGVPLLPQPTRRCSPPPTPRSSSPRCCRTTWATTPRCASRQRCADSWRWWWTPSSSNAPCSASRSRPTPVARAAPATGAGHRLVLRGARPPVRPARRGRRTPPGGRRPRRLRHRGAGLAHRHRRPDPRAGRRPDGVVGGRPGAAGVGDQSHQATQLEPPRRDSRDAQARGTDDHAVGAEDEDQLGGGRAGTVEDLPPREPDGGRAANGSIEITLEVRVALGDGVVERGGHRARRSSPRHTSHRGRRSPTTRSRALDVGPEEADVLVSMLHEVGVLEDGAGSVGNVAQSVLQPTPSRDALALGEGDEQAGGRGAS